ncbi:hypothetical protein CASFOL_037712 [Castilleja foliolosa]|uniref:Uncharacterized protein n=1 Tax=Castilleja foliolosa TaxID=1961234 RepID=A0ABD3BME7_9LAMI
MNKELVRVKREVGAAMTRKGDRRKKVGKSNLPKGVITEEMLADVEANEQVNEEVVTDSGKTCTDVTGNEVVQDEGTMKVTKNMVDDPPEKASEKVCTDEQLKKAPLEKPRVSDAVQFSEVFYAENDTPEVSSLDFDKDCLEG